MSDIHFTPDGKVLRTMGNGEEMAFIFTEELVPPYTLPNPLVFDDGTPVESQPDWLRRRPELLHLLEEHIYGRTPSLPYELSIHTDEDWTPAMQGIAKRKQLTLTISTQYGALDANLLLYAPANTPDPVPAFLGLNFDGNHSIEPDPAIRLNPNWMRENADKGNVDHSASEESRGSADARWPVSMIVEAGFALATLYYGDFDPDFDDGFRNGLHGIFEQPGKPRTGNAWGSIGAWAFGLSRALDALEQEPLIDATRVTTIGHSRLGKTSLWAGAQDERFFAVIDNESGCGGSALYRRCFGEHTRAINSNFPHWFCQNFKAYNDNEASLPLDSHYLLATIAPRPLYIASASEDLWADPMGMYLAARETSPVYELLGKPGLPMASYPALSQTVFRGQVAYHVRPGSHNLTSFDWKQFITFIQTKMNS
jgi:hypothetical protein